VHDVAYACARACAHVRARANERARALTRGARVCADVRCASLSVKRFYFTRAMRACVLTLCALCVSRLVRLCPDGLVCSRNLRLTPFVSLHIRPTKTRIPSSLRTLYSSMRSSRGEWEWMLGWVSH
jgi:hypothetical protein